ncbi:MAG: glycosyltransferase family A protein [Oceanicaulis sp.]
MSLTVLIPTFRRPDSLKRALESVFNQTRTPDEIVVADNAPEASARGVVEALAVHAPCPLAYVHAPEPGVANARNAGFAAAAGDLVAQLDDDESASPGWLAALDDARRETGADVVFGPVSAEAPDHASALVKAYAGRLYDRRPAFETGEIGKPFGCGNSLIDRTRLALPDPVFDPALNETGGEDDRLFTALANAGAVFAWAAEAEVVEHVEGARANWSHLLKRSFAYGQGPSQTAAHLGRPLGVAGWMIVGAAQLAIYGALAAPARLAGAGACAAMIDRAAQGAGKLVWFDLAAPRFYGVARLERSA